MYDSTGREYNMIIKKIIENNTLTVIPGGRLDSSTSESFADFLRENFTEEMDTLVIDMSDVDFISSNGLRIIIMQYKNLNGRKMKLIEANKSVMEVFRLSKLVSVFDISEKKADADDPSSEI